MYTDTLINSFSDDYNYPQRRTCNQMDKKCTLLYAMETDLIHHITESLC